MTEKSSDVERLFAEAVARPPGPDRDGWLQSACGADYALKRQVESLLEAHTHADGFLMDTASAGPEAGAGSSPFQSSANRPGGISAAAHAEAYLGSQASPEILEVDRYVAALPEEVRREARDRIMAGLRVRTLRCSTPAGAISGDEPVPKLKGFRIERKLGEGGLGVVYVAQDEKLDRRVAIKVMRQSSDPRVRRRVLAEARTAASLGDPAIVTVFSVLDEADPPAMVMELVEGFAIDRFAEHLTFEQKAKLLREVARGLSVAHAGSLVHRDLKPANVVVSPDMRPRILDFGLALSLEEAASQGRGFEGTPLYASPEQVLGRPLEPASDIFSFGSLMFKVLTGRPPFEGNDLGEVLHAIATTAPPFLRDVTSGVPEDLQAICLACLAWNPADRPKASEVVAELGRYLVGEPVRLRPKLYDDLLRRSISEYAHQARGWESQSIISREEHDALDIVHRRLLADEDHWIIDARRITPIQTLLSAGTWLVVVATVLTVWMLREDLGSPWRWLLPAAFALGLLGCGHVARHRGESLAAATFLAGGALAVAPFCLSMLAELDWLSQPGAGVAQLFDRVFTNQQVWCASLIALGVSVFGLWRLQLTGFAWTTAALGTASYLSLLLMFNWLERPLEHQALWCLPLAMAEAVALWLERLRRVRWTLPFHLVALVTVVAGLDVMAMQGPTLDMLGVTGQHGGYWNHDRRLAFSLVGNGFLFLMLMMAAERSASLDLRRGSRLLEVLAILHILGPLFHNALQHRDDPWVRWDVWLYVAAAMGMSVLAPLRSRWRLLVGGLAGCGLGSYLLVDLGLVARRPFILGLGLIGLICAVGAFVFVSWGATSAARRNRP